MKLFRKKIEKHCAYCVHACSVNEREAVCAYRGVTDRAAHCRRFAYDPLKRVPPRPATIQTEKYSPEDFAL